MASTILVKSTIQTPTHNYRAQDITDYSTFLYFSDSQSILKLDGPLATLYNNTSFGSPDFNYPGTLTKDMNIPLVSGSIPMGNYTLTTTTRVIRVSIPVSSVNLGTNSFKIPLTLSGNFGGATSIIWTGGANAGTYTINSVTDDGFTTIVTVVESLVSASTTGSVGYTETVETVDEYTLCYEAPTAKLLLPYNCATAILEWEDDTNYAITCEGTSILPSSQSLEIVIESPYNEAGSHVYPTTTTASATGATTELWTGAWIGTLTNNLVYILPSGLYLEATITGSTSVNVNCDATLCCMSTCIINATNTFTRDVASTSNLNTIQQALVQYTKILGAFMRYSVGVSCGNTTIITNAVTDMQTYLAGTGCCTDCSESGQSTQVVAIYNVIVSGNTLIVQSGDVYVDISEVVVGDTTTATFTLNVSALEALISSYIAATPSIVTDIVNEMALRTTVAAEQSVGLDDSVIFTGSYSTGSPIVTLTAFGTNIDADDILIGEIVTNSNGDFPAGTYVIAKSASTLTLSQDATNTNTDSFYVGSIKEGQQVRKFKRIVSGVDQYMFLTAVGFQNSILPNASTNRLELVNDEAIPDNFDFYGYNSGKAWIAFLTAVANYTKVNQSAVTATIPNGSTVTAATLSLAAGTWIVLASAKLVRASDGLVVFTLNDGASAFYTGGINLDGTYNPNQNLSVMYQYTSASAITLTLKFEGSGAAQTNGLRERCLIAIRIA